MDKVIITGASGFIGKNLVELLESKYEVIKLSNLSDYQFVLDKLTGIGKVKPTTHTNGFDAPVVQASVPTYKRIEQL